MQLIAPHTSNDVVIGLYGKLPAHGDFVQRGWSAATVAALDRWVTEGVAAVADGVEHDGFAARMTAAPLWFAYAPPEWAGPDALHFVLTPSIDRAGRYFMLLCGVSGDANTVWALASQQPDFATSVAAAVYAALRGGLDADALVATLESAAQPPDSRALLLAGLAVPSEAAFWTEDSPIALRARTADCATIFRLVEPA